MFGAVSSSHVDSCHVDSLVRADSFKHVDSSGRAREPESSSHADSCRCLACRCTRQSGSTAAPPRGLSVGVRAGQNTGTLQGEWKLAVQDGQGFGEPCGFSGGLDLHVPGRCIGRFGGRSSDSGAAKDESVPVRSRGLSEMDGWVVGVGEVKAGSAGALCNRTWDSAGGGVTGSPSVQSKGFGFVHTGMATSSATRGGGARGWWACGGLVGGRGGKGVGVGGRAGWRGSLVGPHIVALEPSGPSLSASFGDSTSSGGLVGGFVLGGSGGSKGSGVGHERTRADREAPRPAQVLVRAERRPGARPELWAGAAPSTGRLPGGRAPGGIDLLVNRRI